MFKVKGQVVNAIFKYVLAAVADLSLSKAPEASCGSLETGPKYPLN
jgi:hypothetical protein